MVMYILGENIYEYIYIYMKQLEVNINEIEINGKNKNIIDLYRGNSELNEGSRTWTNFVKD